MTTFHIEERLTNIFAIRPCPKKKGFSFRNMEHPYGMMQQSTLKKKAMTLNMRVGRSAEN